MLCQEVENGKVCCLSHQSICILQNLTMPLKVKCAKYWPEEGTSEFGNVIVTHMDTSDFKYVTVRTFRVSSSKNISSPRDIFHCQYTAWPDHGLPASSTDLLALCEVVSKFSPSAPIVVHCSAGVGRTGVFCTMHSVLEYVRSRYERFGRNTPVDIAGTILKFRTARSGMIQTKKQFIFTYNSIIDGCKHIADQYDFEIDTN